MQRKTSKLNVIMAVFFLIITLNGCTVDSFGTDKTPKSYTRINEEAKIPDLVDENRTVNWVLKNEDIKEFTIFDDLSYVDKVMINNSFAGLFTLVDSKVSMDLVKTVSVSETGREYTLELRESKWSNGEKITAYDVINSWTKYNEKSDLSLFEKVGIEKARALDQNLINIKLFRSNDNLLYYLSDLDYKVYSDEALQGAKLASDDNTIPYSGKYIIKYTDDIEALKLIKNDKYYGAISHYINEVHIVPSEIFSQNKNDRYEFYLDSSQDIKDYEELIDGSDDFNYLPTGVIKSLVINPELEKLSDKYRRIKLLDSLDVKGVTDYSSKGLATVVDTFAVIDNWNFDYGYLEENIIAKQDNSFDFDDISITYIDSSENQMIYEILSLMFSTNYGLNLISNSLDYAKYQEIIEANDYELLIKDMDKFASLSDSYLINLESQLPKSYDAIFDYDYYDNIKRYQHTSDLKYLKKAELNLKLNSYISPMYNCGFPVMGDERLNLKEFYNSDYLDFSTIKYE